MQVTRSIVVLVATLVLLEAVVPSVLGAAAEEAAPAKATKTTKKTTTKTQKSNGTPKIKRTVRLREVQPEPSAPAAPQHVEMNNTGGLNQVEVKPTISIAAPEPQVSASANQDDDDDDGQEDRDEAKQIVPYEPSEQVEIVKDSGNKVNEITLGSGNQIQSSLANSGNRQVHLGANNQNHKQTVLTNSGNSEVVHIDGVGNNKITKISNSGNKVEEHQEQPVSTVQAAPIQQQQQPQQPFVQINLSSVERQQAQPIVVSAPQVQSPLANLLNAPYLQLGSPSWLVDPRLELAGRPSIVRSSSSPMSTLFEQVNGKPASSAPDFRQRALAGLPVAPIGQYVAAGAPTFAEMPLAVSQAGQLMAPPPVPFLPYYSPYPFYPVQVPMMLPAPLPSREWRPLEVEREEPKKKKKKKSKKEKRVEIHHVHVPVAAPTTTTTTTTPAPTTTTTTTTEKPKPAFKTIVVPADYEHHNLKSSAPVVEKEASSWLPARFLPTFGGSSTPTTTPKPAEPEEEIEYETIRVPKRRRVVQKE